MEEIEEEEEEEVVHLSPRGLWLWVGFDSFRVSPRWFLENEREKEEEREVEESFAFEATV